MVRFKLDHLVFACATLQQAETFSLSKFGIKPHLGGKHEFMGTHNSLIKLGSSKLSPKVGLERTYLEFISVDPNGVFMPNETHKRRWFNLDDEKLQVELKENGPKLIHFVVSMEDENISLENFKTRLETLHEDSLFRTDKFHLGNVVQGSRTTLQGAKLKWSICIRQDGRLLMNGLFPTLIQWNTTTNSANYNGDDSRRTTNGTKAFGVHPTDLLPNDDGLVLKQFKVFFGCEKTKQNLIRLISSLNPSEEGQNNSLNKAIRGVQFESRATNGFEAVFQSNSQNIIIRDLVTD